MRKIFFIIIHLCIVQNISFAHSNITFIYIHGSNSNTIKNRQWFEKGVHKLHPVLREELEKKVEGKNISPNISDYVINTQPKFFFWGYNSEIALESMKNRLKVTKSTSAPGAFWARKVLSAELHDAVWIVKSRHLIPVLDKLNQQVIQEHNEGNKVILSGFSIGTFITYKYLLFKLRYLNVEDIFKDLKISDKEISDFIKSHPQENTCLSAISSGDIGSINLDGKFSLNKNKDVFKQNYLNLEQLSNRFCAPKDAILGVINYGSPLAIFNSEIEDEGYEFAIYSKNLFKDVINKGLFFITINFIEDPLGFPLILKGEKSPEDNSNPNPKGLIYDNYSVKSWRWFIVAHTSYYSARKIFSREIVKSFNVQR